jgi:hypothetical protein
MQLASLVVHIPSTGAGTDDQWYIAFPYRGTWRIKGILFAPATAVAAAATDYTTVTITVNDGAAGSDSSAVASFNTNTGGTALVLKTTVDLTVSQVAGGELSRGKQIKIAKADTASGDILDGTFTFELEKIN